MVVTTYTSGDLERGTIGIIGPRRMNYPKVIASVDYMSKLLTRTLKKAG
jgi:heat-inducible transcriptional repressor